MNEQKWIDPKKQFSKRLARWTAVFWFAFMTWLSILFLLVPEAALYTVYMGIIVTVVMVLNVWAYTKNSIYEKSMLAMLNKVQLELSLGKKPDDQQTEGEGGESNG